jgi:hypothetical protein
MNLLENMKKVNPPEDQIMFQALIAIKSSIIPCPMRNSKRTKDIIC